MEHHRESRKRLRPWLERMIQNGECPGLMWDNYDERTFRIPWRHFNNRDWDSRDSQIFKEWAKYTGRYQEGEEPEYPVWKTRLRCALKKIPEIKELKELHKLEDPNPYRVYQFIDPPAHRKGEPLGEDTDGSSASHPCTPSAFSASPYHRDFLDDSMTPPPPNFLEEKCYHNQSTVNTNVPTVIYENEGNAATGFNKLAKENHSHFFQLYAKTAQTQTPPPPTTMTHSVITENAAAVPELAGYQGFNIHPGDNNIVQAPSSSQSFTMMLMDQPGQPIMRVNGLNQLNEIKVEQPQQDSTGNKTSLPSDLMSLDSGDLCHIQDMELNPSLEMSLPSSLLSHGQRNEAMKVEHTLQLHLSYGSPAFDAGKQVVYDNGCRLYFAEKQVSLGDTLIEEKMFGPKHVMQIMMPAAEGFEQISRIQKDFIKELLSSMERGLVLTLVNGDVYARRLCRTRVFVSDGTQQSQLLDRTNENSTKVFDFNGAFKDAVQKYLQRETDIKPKSFFYLTFGQEIKKSQPNPLNRVLIHVKVTHTEASKIVANLEEPSMLSSLFCPLLSSFNKDDQLLNEFKKMVI